MNKKLPPKPIQNPPKQPAQPPIPPLPNYTLSTVCPNCASPTIRRACKVRCEKCGFMWDCSEL
ncbi:MAG: hypothetical protein MUE54_01900 [Anaerolineae bacterium]|nr:hypothetical protein [Anaerolineae bacterium]